MMNRYLQILAALLLLSGFTLAQKPFVAPAPDEKLFAELLELKRHWGKIYVKRDRAALELLLGKEYTVTDDDGATTDRRAIMADFGSDETVYENVSYTDARISVYGEVAIVAGRGTVRGRGKNGAFATEYFSTNVFVRRDGRWQAVATHISGSKRL